MDIEALYPSLDIVKCSTIIADEMYKSDIKIRNIKWKEVMLYLRFMLSDEKIKQYGLWQFTPSRRNSRGRHPTFLSSGSDLREQDRLKSWIFNDIEVSEEQEKRMFTIALGILVHETVTNHAFIYDSKIYKQEEGGAIGLELVGVIAKIYMCWWDRQLIQRTLEKGLQLVMYKRYVDDCNIVAVDLSGGIITDEEIARKISLIADTIDPSIKSTYDFGSKYADKRLPMLDLKMWIEKDRNGIWRIMHSHYMKEVSSKYLIYQRSCHPSNMKLSVLVNEGLRICRNISIHLPWDESRQHLQEFVRRMHFSGFDEHMRAKVLSKVLDKNEERMKKFSEIGRMYRSRSEQYNEKRKAKEGRKNNWYDRTKYDGVMFVDVTENSVLLKEVRKAVKKNKLKIKVVEKMKSTLKSELQRSNPFGNVCCERLTCKIF